MGYRSGSLCGPDGHSWSAESLDKCLQGNTGRGALIGKIGGGTADRTGYIFPVGHFTIIEIPENAIANGPTRGALFLTMNDEPSRFREHTGDLLVSIWEAA